MFGADRSRIDGQFQVGCILVEDEDLCIVQWLELDGITLAVGTNRTDTNLLAEHAVLNHSSTIRIQLDLFLYLDLFLLFLLLITFVGLILARRGRKLLVDLLQILVLVVECLQIEATLPVDHALVLDGVTDHLGGVGNDCTPIPVVGSIVGDGTVDPIQYRNVLERHVPGHLEGLIVGHRCTQIPDALTD